MTGCHPNAKPKNEINVIKESVQQAFIPYGKDNKIRVETLFATIISFFFLGAVGAIRGPFRKPMMVYDVYLMGQGCYGRAISDFAAKVLSYLAKSHFKKRAIFGTFRGLSKQALFPRK